ncbi:MAG TPA: class I SAM-dependent methyltransferase [Candidatus Paceibacterota bacterium]|nr:class I SAM-dependent methyltransferase [Candidatus Paceibacterota bacterium]
MRTFHRRHIDQLQKKYRDLYHGVVLDIGGRDRGVFQKPKGRVQQWIFADIAPGHHPDIVLDVSDMSPIETASIDVVSALELFEHVENVEAGLDECARVLKPGGTILLSAPFLHPIHADPFDFQRWTKYKWQKELEQRKFRVEKIEITGYFFSVLADMGLAFARSSPRILRKPLQLLASPFLFFSFWLDQKKWITQHPKLSQYHGGYFIVAKNHE